MLQINWPVSLKDSSAVQAIERSLAARRLGHALLFIADELPLVEDSARALIEHLLGGKLPHADYLQVEPANKMRQIGVEPMRVLREFLQKSSLSGTKVVHISQADRLNTTAANLFLKILEEPPMGSYIIMTTSQPYAVLPTIISRAMRFRLSADLSTTRAAAIEQWCKSLYEYLNKSRSVKKPQLLERYLLVHTAYELLEAEPEATKSKEDTEEKLDKELREAQEVAKQKAYRKEFLSAFERTVLDYYKSAPVESERLTQALRSIERAYRLMDFNLNNAAALELAVGGVVEALAD